MSFNYRVAIVIDSLVGGGAERVMLSLAQAMQTLGVQVQLLSLANRVEHALPENLQIDTLFDHKATKVDRFWQRRKSVAKLEQWFAQQQPFDLVLSNLDRSNNLLSESDIENVHYVVHNSITAELARQKKLGPLAYRYLRRAKARLNGQSLVCVSKGIEQEIAALEWLNPTSTTAIYNPFIRDEITSLAAESNDAIPDEPYIIHVGRLAKQKRHDVLFSAISQAQGDFKVVLLSNKPDKTRALAQRYGIEERLILPGFQTNPYNWIQRAQALVLSSDYEGFPGVLIEAMQLNTPVVSTNCTHGPSEILTGSLAAYLSPVGDSKALANNISQCLLDKPQVDNAPVLAHVDALEVAKKYLALI